MDKLLTSAQCDKFVQCKHIDIWYDASNCEWMCDNMLESHYVSHDFTSHGKTRQEAVTAYQQKYHPDWQPPEIHDVDWAMQYIEEHPELCIARETLDGILSIGQWLAYIKDETYPAIGRTLVEAVETWYEKYGTKESPLPTILETLERCRDRLADYGTLYSHTLREVDAVIAREKEKSK